MENYLFYEPLRKLKATVESGEIGDVSGYHLKMVASGRGGWDVPLSSYEWQFQQMQRGRGILVFDDGWHKLADRALAVRPDQRGAGLDRRHRGRARRRRSTRRPRSCGSTRTAIRGVWDITLAPDMYLRSDYYTNDERWEVTGRKGYARVNRCTGPRHPAAEPRGVRRRRDALATTRSTTTGRSSFRDSGRHWLRWLHTGEGPLLWSGEEAVDVLRFALAAYASSAAGGIGVDPAGLE